MKFDDENEEIYEDIDVEDIEMDSEAEPDVSFKDAAAGFSAMVKALTLKKVLLIAALAIMVIAVPVVISLLPEKPNYFFVKNSISMFATDNTLIVSAGESDLFAFDSKIIYGAGVAESSIDKSKAAVLSIKDDDSNAGALWYISAAGKQFVADDVYGFMISDNGNAIAYFTDLNTETYSVTLNLHDSETEESIVIAENAVGRVSISPDGKTVSYITDYSYDTEQTIEQFSTYIKTVGKPEELLGENMLCLAVADDAKYIYYVDFGNTVDPASLLVRSESGDTVIISDYTFNNTSALNKDYSQLLYEYRSKTYICRDGGVPEFVADWVLYDFLLPYNTQWIQHQNGNYFSVCGIRDFAGIVFNANDKYLYIDNNYSAIRIPIDDYYVYAYVSDVFLTADGKTVIFTDDDKALCRFDFTDPYAEREIIAENGIQFTASYDGDVVYYLNSDNELWRAEGTGKKKSEPVKIAEGVSRDTLVLSDSSDTIFFITDYNSYKNTGGKLCYSREGGEKVVVRENVKSVWATAENVFYSIASGSDDGKSDIYRSNGDGNFELLCESVYY